MLRRSVVWTDSGGYCRNSTDAEYLFVEDADVDFGELAHIIPAAARGPRGAGHVDMSPTHRAHHMNTKRAPAGPLGGQAATHVRPPTCLSRNRFPMPVRQHHHVTRSENQAQFYWQSSAAGLLLGTALGGLTGIGVALHMGTGSSAEYTSASLLLALPLLGVLVGAVCGGAAGVAGSMYTSQWGRLPHFLLSASVALITAMALGALFTAFSRTGWAYSAAIALPASVVLGVALPRAAERLRRPPSTQSYELE